MFVYIGGKEIATSEVPPRSYTFAIALTQHEIHYAVHDQFIDDIKIVLDRNEVCFLISAWVAIIKFQ